MQASYFLVLSMFIFVLFIYLFLTFLSRVAEAATKGALENRCLTTVLKIIEKYP